ncbi:hypothetical protein NE688_21135, partial [Eubacterium callanderi]
REMWVIFLGPFSSDEVTFSLQKCHRVTNWDSRHHRNILRSFTEKLSSFHFELTVRLVLSEECPCSN